MFTTKKDLCSKLTSLNTSNHWDFKEVFYDGRKDSIYEFILYKNKKEIINWFDYEGYDLFNIKSVTPDELYLIGNWLDVMKDYLYCSDEEIETNI